MISPNNSSNSCIINNSSTAIATKFRSLRHLQHIHLSKTAEFIASSQNYGCTLCGKALIISITSFMGGSHNLQNVCIKESIKCPNLHILITVVRALLTNQLSFNFKGLFHANFRHIHCFRHFVFLSKSIYYRQNQNTIN